MSTLSTTSLSLNTNPVEYGYLKNVARAAGALFNALFSVAPRRADQMADDRTSLYRLATEYDLTMPNLATELRFLAARG